MSMTHRVDTTAALRAGRLSAALLALAAGSSTGLAQLSDQQRSLLDEAVRALEQTQAPSEPAAAQGAADDGEFNGDVSIDENFLVDLHVADENLANVLQMLSIQSQRNIVASKSVSASITANLYGVTFYEALDAILHVNGYGYVERGNFIYVYTLEELEQIEQAQRTRSTRVLRMNYLNATDAAAFATPLLSSGGTMTTNGATATFSIPESAPTGADEFVHDATIVIHDYPENVEEIERLLRELDTRPQQVLVEATILQTSLNEANAFGVDFSLIADINFGDFVGIGGPLRAADGLITGEGARVDGTEVQVPSDNVGRAITSTPGNTRGPGTFKAAVIAEDAAIFLRLLDEVSDTTILSNPKILALNRQPARVLVGRKVGYLNTTSTETSTTQTVEFLDTGTQLYFRPFVTNEGFIRMELKPQVSEAEIRTATDATGAAVTVPDEITNELVTNVMVRDGNTIVLGGLFRETTQSDRRQVPVLGDIPLIGAAFRGHEDDVNRSEIIFMITPTIVNDEFLLATGAAGQEFVESSRAGAREGLLPFSRERQASQLLVEADRLVAQGNTDKALHKVQRALALKPNYPQAVALRERLMGKPAIWPSNSMLEDIIGNEAERRAEEIMRSEAPAQPAPQSVSAEQFAGQPQAEARVGANRRAEVPQRPQLQTPAPSQPQAPQASAPEGDNPYLRTIGDDEYTGPSDAQIQAAWGASAYAGTAPAQPAEPQRPERGHSSRRAQPVAAGEGVNPAFIRSIDPGAIPTTMVSPQFNEQDFRTRELVGAEPVRFQPQRPSLEGRLSRSEQKSARRDSTTENAEPMFTTVPTDSGTQD